MCDCCDREPVIVSRGDKLSVITVSGVTALKIESVTGDIAVYNPDSIKLVSEDELPAMAATLLKRRNGIK